MELDSNRYCNLFCLYENECSFKLCKPKAIKMHLLGTMKIWHLFYTICNTYAWILYIILCQSTLVSQAWLALRTCPAEILNLSESELCPHCCPQYSANWYPLMHITSKPKLPIPRFRAAGPVPPCCETDGVYKWLPQPAQCERKRSMTEIFSTCVFTYFIFNLYLNTIIFLTCVFCVCVLKMCLN